MRYPASRKRETRSRLIDSSRAIAKGAGFQGTGVDALMAAIGLSGGAFYGHFESKAELFAAIVQHEMAHSTALLAAAGDGDPDALARSLDRYLSTAHADEPQAGCALPALGAEIARADAALRGHVELALARLHRGWSERLGGDADRAWALISQCVGAILIARVVAGAGMRRRILASNRRIARDTVIAASRRRPSTPKGQP